jgi:NitT/TauT family transport system substrate-binding protein
LPPLDQLVLAGPPAPPTLYLAHLAQQEALATQVRSVRFEQWKSPDQLRAGILSGTYHVAATPVNVAANLYRKGVSVRLLDVTVWGILSVLTTEDAISSLADLKGRDIAVPFRGDMPDIVLGVLLRKLGLVPGKDVRIIYVGSPFEGMQLLIARRINTVLLPEPASTAALMRGAGAGLPIRRAVDVQEAWAQINGGPARFPQAGTIVQAQLADDRPELITALAGGIKTAVDWIAANPASAARLGADEFKLNPEIVARSLAATKMEAVPAKNARPAIEKFFGVLADVNAALIGGGLPDADFYLG